MRQTKTKWKEQISYHTTIHSFYFPFKYFSSHHIRFCLCWMAIEKRNLSISISLVIRFFFSSFFPPPPYVCIIPAHTIRIQVTGPIWFGSPHRNVCGYASITPITSLGS